jgi:hypothetical protein
MADTTTPDQGQNLATCTMDKTTLVFIMIYHLKNSIEDQKLSESLSDKPGLGGISSAQLWQEDVVQTLRMAGCYKAECWPASTTDWLDMCPTDLATRLLQPFFQS